MNLYIIESKILLTLTHSASGLPTSRPYTMRILSNLCVKKIILRSSSNRLSRMRSWSWSYGSRIHKNHEFSFRSDSCTAYMMRRWGCVMDTEWSRVRLWKTKSGVFCGSPLNPFKISKKERKYTLLISFVYYVYGVFVC